MKRGKATFLFAAAVFACAGLVCGGAAYAQEFGFGFDDEAESATSAPPVTVKIGGEIAADFTGFVHDFESAEKAKAASLGDIVSAALDFSAAGANVDAFIGIELSPSAIIDLVNYSAADAAWPPSVLDEAYLRAYLGNVSVQAGLRKLTWGKADSLGPLDVINPLDYSDLTNITDITAIKIACPLVHAAWNIDGFSKLEAIFIPNFAGHRFAQDGRWVPAQYSDMPGIIKNEMIGRASELKPELLPALMTLAPELEAKSAEYMSAGINTSSLEYFQTGLRFTTTLGPADIGAQYFYGNLFRPSFFISGTVDNIIAALNNNTDPASLDGIDFASIPDISYNRYHQFGLDYAQVLFGFNARSEFAFHLTEDFSGDNGAVRNPFIAWSFGFDRDLFWGINANIQVNETVRLFNGKVGKNPVLDFEAGTDITSTRLTMQVSKNFLRDNLESKVTAIWDIENSDCYIIPAIAWTIRDFCVELSAGVFAGKESGELGQYWENSFIRAGISYSF